MTASGGAAARPSHPDLAGLAAGEIGRLVRTGRLSPVAVLADFLARIDAANDSVNAIVALRADGARHDAVALANAIDAGADPGPLAGVPFTVKDVIATADLPTTCGSRLLREHRTVLDATATARMRQAGAILVGKTNCPEFAFGVDTDSPLHGRTRNPLGRFTPGGSSGGESAAVAAGFSAIGLGTDFGGSLRWPAHCTGLVGLRPTVGRVPGTGQLPSLGMAEPAIPDGRSMQGRLQVIGPIARTVADAELALRVLAGPDEIDPDAVATPLRPAAEVDIGAVELSWAARVGAVPVHAELAGTVRWAATALSRRGARATEGLPEEVSHAPALYGLLRDTDPLLEIRRLAAGRDEELSPAVQHLVHVRDTASNEYVATLWARRNMLRAGLLRWLTGERVLLLPVAAAPAFDPERGIPLIAGQQIGEWDVLTCSRAISLFGLPALAVPCGRTAEGRPASVQIVGPPFREDLVLAVGQALESATAEESR